MRSDDWWAHNARLLAQRFALHEALPFRAGGESFTGDRDQLLAIHAHPHGARVVRLYLPSPANTPLLPGPSPDTELSEIPLLLSSRGVWIVLWPDADSGLAEAAQLGLALRSRLATALARRGWEPSGIPIGFSCVLHRLDRREVGELEQDLAEHLVCRDELDRLFEKIVATPLQLSEPDPCALHRLLVDLLDLGEVVDLHEPAWTAHLIVPDALLPRPLSSTHDRERAA